MSDWLDVLVRLRAQLQPAAMVTVVATRGSVPREAGTRMIVTAGAVHGTIGGGHLELQAIGIARNLLASTDGAAGCLRRFPLGASLGQCCGGVVNLLFERVDGDAPWVDNLRSLRERNAPAILVSPAEGRPTMGTLLVTADDASGTHGIHDAAIVAIARDMLANGGAPKLVRCGAGDPAPLLFFDPVRGRDFHIVLFGAGHVGRAIARILGSFDCRVTWVDGRSAEFPADVPANVAVVCTDAPEAEVDAAPASAYFLVMTHSHALDEQLTERILHRHDFAYFGLIGSKSKRRQFERRMERRGMPAARFADMTCPIGIPGISGKEPATIAVAVAAQLLQFRAKALAVAQGPAGAGAAMSTVHAHIRSETA